MAMRWYVIRAISGRESKIKENIDLALRRAGLLGQVSQLLIPVERVTEVKRRGKVTMERKLYPGYIYGEMELSQPLLEAIVGVDGVGGFLGSDPQHPDPLSTEEAERILKIANAVDPSEQRAAMVSIPFNPGDKVRVKEGTFAGMDGSIDDINREKGTMRVLITVFGRQTPIELEAWQVEEQT